MTREESFYKEFKKALAGEDHEPLDGCVCLGSPQVRPIKPGETSIDIIRNVFLGGIHEKQRK